ncbi:uncharacterized protein LY89DRAFT_739569 [Mollisia scopiformis]|uniref:Uncharacterized protein n=1 Tax=Mollisia scopiformis TaxID=149040 RepID=A0A194WTW4_MOLSC|nr:uncharacterized protein LY89DRAFT_739569 [Mollisia scopiformis]KUJ11381.1 hypothetical protein LY89DRAFT_739569 [Mollisia scopiformis]
MKSPTSLRSSLLLNTTTSFCSSLTQSQPIPPLDLIHRFFVSSPKVTEHGPEWARSRLPFLSKTFSGRNGCVEYFELLGETLKMEMGEGTFPSKESGEWVVDEGGCVEGGEDEGVVTVVGKARFESLKTGKGWEEKFIYRFSGFDSSGKIGHWEIWADPLSAWVACEEGKF